MSPLSKDNLPNVHTKKVQKPWKFLSQLSKVTTKIYEKVTYFHLLLRTDLLM